METCCFHWCGKREIELGILGTCDHIMEFICFAFYVLGSALQVGSVSFVGSVVYHSSTSGRVSSGYQTPSLLDQVMYIVGFISSRIPERERES